MLVRAVARRADVVSVFGDARLAGASTEAATAARDAFASAFAVNPLALPDRGLAAAATEAAASAEAWR